MIDIKNLEKSEPYMKFNEFYELALKKNQSEIQAISISSFDHNTNEVESRYVNLKYIIENQWIFFTNYNSTKAKSFNSHNQISALFFWDKINAQIRIKAHLKKVDNEFSDYHFQNRSIEKNAIAISSKQSEKIDSYESVKNNYKKALMLKNKNHLQIRPKYWGGYTFTPYYFEFWTGNQSRINKRECFKLNDSLWESFFIQP